MSDKTQVERMLEIQAEYERDELLDDLAARRDSRIPTPDGPPAIEISMEDDRITFRDQEALDEYSRGARAEAWGEGWNAAQEVVDFDGRKVWAHTVFPDEYAGNPYDAALARPTDEAT